MKDQTVVQAGMSVIVAGALAGLGVFFVFVMLLFASIGYTNDKHRELLNACSGQWQNK